MARILVVEDESDVSALLERGLKEEGFEVGCAADGETALRLLRQGDWNLLILDLMLPDLPGETILSYLNQSLNKPPVLVLTARGDVNSKLGLFRLGCDDYLVKPFVYDELLARVSALLRRPPRVNASSFRYEDIVLEDEPQELNIGGEKVGLTPKEYAICRLLLSEPGRVVTRKELLQSIWGYTLEPSTNFIEVHLANLRKKLKPLGRDEWVRTLRSAGISLSRPSPD